MHHRELMQRLVSDHLDPRRGTGDRFRMDDFPADPLGELASEAMRLARLAAEVHQAADGPDRGSGEVRPQSGRRSRTATPSRSEASS